MIQLIKSFLHRLNELTSIPSPSMTPILTLTRNVEKFDVVERITVPTRIKM